MSVKGYHKKKRRKSFSRLWEKGYLCRDHVKTLKKSKIMKRCYVAIFEDSSELSRSSKFFDVRIGESVQELRRLNKINELVNKRPDWFYFKIRSNESSAFFMRLLDDFQTDSVLLDSAQFLSFVQKVIQPFQTPQSFINPCQKLKSSQGSLQPSSFRS